MSFGIIRRSQSWVYHMPIKFVYGERRREDKHKECHLVNYYQKSQQQTILPFFIPLLLSHSNPIPKPNYISTSHGDSTPIPSNLFWLPTAFTLNSQLSTMAPSSLLLPLSLALLCLLSAPLSTYKSSAMFTSISILIFKKKTIYRMTLHPI